MLFIKRDDDLSLIWRDLIAQTALLLCVDPRISMADDTWLFRLPARPPGRKVGQGRHSVGGDVSPPRASGCSQRLRIRLGLWHSSLGDWDVGSLDRIWLGLGTRVSAAYSSAPTLETSEREETGSARQVRQDLGTYEAQQLHTRLALRHETQLGPLPLTPKGKE